MGEMWLPGRQFGPPVGSLLFVKGVDHITKGSGKRIDLFGQSMDFLWDAEDTTIMINVVPKGIGAPMHIHHKMDEACFVMSGQLKVVVEGEEMLANPGDYVRIARGIPHGFVGNSEEPTVLFWVTTPGGYKQFFEEIVAATGGSGEPDFDVIAGIAAKIDTDFCGPVPTPD